MVLNQIRRQDPHFIPTYSYEGTLAEAVQDAKDWVQSKDMEEWCLLLGLPLSRMRNMTPAQAAAANKSLMYLLRRSNAKVETAESAVV